MHRDLKPSNILLDKDDEIRIGDFRTARIVDVVGFSMSGGLGNAHYYAAPEIGEDNQTHYGKEVDVFSYAMVLWEILTGRSVVTGYPEGKDIGFIAHHWRINGGERPSTDDLEPDAVGLLESCWETESYDRISFDEILEYLRDNNYGILHGVNVVEMAIYVAQLEEYEKRYPPEDLSAVDEEDE
jgi:serine/threonine protein kinase